MSWAITTYPSLRELSIKGVLTFFWGFVKSRVYRTQVRDLNYLRHRIHDAMDGVTEEILKNTWRELQKRLDFVAENGGRHCELR